MRAYLEVRTFAAVRAGESRNVPLTGRLLEVLRVSTAEGDHVSTARTELSETWLDQLSAERTLLKLPKDFVLHSLRHTRLGESGADAFTIMKLIEGHSSVTVSQRYVHPSPESVERAVAGHEGQNVAEWQKVGIESVIPNVRQYSRPH